MIEDRGQAPIARCDLDDAKPCGLRNGVIAAASTQPGGDLSGELDEGFADHKAIKYPSPLNGGGGIGPIRT